MTVCQQAITLPSWLHHASGFFNLYTLRVLRAHGLPQQSLNDVYWATIQGTFLYAVPHGLVYALRG